MGGGGGEGTGFAGGGGGGEKEERGTDGIRRKRTIGRMARLIRMDGTGHTTLAEWTAADSPSVDAAVAAFRSSSTPASTPS